VEIAEEVKSISNWHRRMTHESLNQKGQRYNMDHFVEGAKMYFYRPPSVLDVAKKTRTHRSLCRTGDDRQENRQPLFLYLIPLQVQLTQLLQRDAGMITLKKEWLTPSQDPVEVKLATARHQAGVKLRVGEMVIMMNYPDAKDWYVAKSGKS
jgi:hypothetical protein